MKILVLSAALAFLLAAVAWEVMCVRDDEEDANVIDAEIDAEEDENVIDAEADAEDTETRESDSDSDTPPSLHMACPMEYNCGLCHLLLLEHICADHIIHSEDVDPEQEFIDADLALEAYGTWRADRACKRIYVEEPSPKKYYCLAAANEHKHTMAAAVSKVITTATGIDYPEVCNLSAKQGPNTDNKIGHGCESGTDGSIGNLVGMDSLANQVIEACNDIMRPNGFLQPETLPNANGLDDGFCRDKNSPGQDCSFLKGIRDNWNTSHGEVYCNGTEVKGTKASGKFPGEAGSLRCLGLQSQLVEAFEDAKRKLVETKATETTVVKNVRQDMVDQEDKDKYNLEEDVKNPTKLDELKTENAQDLKWLMNLPKELTNLDDVARLEPQPRVPRLGKSAELKSLYEACGVNPE